MAFWITPLAYALFLWWFSTGVILYLDGLPRRTFRWTMLGATAVLAGALFGLVASGTDTSPQGAYVAFTCGVLIWAWHETSFLLGILTGSRKTPCPPGCTGWRRFRYAAASVMHHELAIAATMALVVALTWTAPNQVGTWTFAVLWGMRLSAKLNVFLGVPNLNLNFLPDHLAYIGSFFARRPMNLLFPISITVSTILAGRIVAGALAAEPGSFEAVGLAFAATLLSLAILEHWLMVLPIPVEALWSWGFRSRSTDRLDPPIELQSPIDLAPARLAAAPHDDIPAFRRAR